MPLFAGVFLMACAAQTADGEPVVVEGEQPLDDEASVEQTSAPLIAGTAPTLRPEIGQFSRGCTATLIAPRYAITAAHCIAATPLSAITDLSSQSGDMFTFTDRLGALQNYPVTKLYALGRDAGEYVPQHDHSVDVMLLQLASPVPTYQAIPAKLARTYPAAGSPVTTFGFGCQNRSAPGTGGFKQFFTFGYAPHGSDNLCPGDSGGPLVFGNAAGNGAIFGINSGYFCFFGCHDDYGDAAWMANAVEALIRKLEGGIEEGMDRPGMDFTSFTTTNAAQCSSYCSTTYNFVCKAFTFVPTSWSSGTCFLKDALPDRTPIESPTGIFSGVNVTKFRDHLERGTNRAGADYDHFTSPSADSCKTSCARDNRCRAFTYAGGVCWLKNAVPAPTDAATDVVSAVRGGFEMEKNRAGADFDHFDVQLPEDCQSRCANDVRCIAWTWTRPTSSVSAHCWLKTSSPALSDNANCISGVKNAEFFPGQ